MRAILVGGAGEEVVAMRFVSFVLAVLLVLVGTTVEARAQAGRYVPLPAPRVPPGGGGAHGLHLPFELLGCGTGSYLFWGLAAVGGLVLLGGIGFRIGEALGGKRSPAGGTGSPAKPSPSVPRLQDLILQPAEVEEKARQTTRLLEALARRDPAFDPALLREYITATFLSVQRCWEARDYGPVREQLGTEILANHLALVEAMRANHEINRVEDLRVLRLEFVHVWYPVDADFQEVTALITFEARVYFIGDRSRRFLRGSKKVLPYQEFWLFRRYARAGAAWQLHAIQQSHESNRLAAENHVTGMRDQGACQAGDGVILL